MLLPRTFSFENVLLGLHQPCLMSLTLININCDCYGSNLLAMFVCQEDAVQCRFV